MTLQIALTEGNVAWTFVVVRDLVEQLLVGKNILKDAKIDMPGRRLTVGGKVFNFRIQQRMDRERVTTITSVTIPAQTALYIEARVGNNIFSGDRLMIMNHYYGVRTAWLYRARILAQHFTNGRERARLKKGCSFQLRI